MVTRVANQISFNGIYGITSNSILGNCDTTNPFVVGTTFSRKATKNQCRARIYTNRDYKSAKDNDALHLVGSRNTGGTQSYKIIATIMPETTLHPETNIELPTGNIEPAVMHSLATYDFYHFYGG